MHIFAARAYEGFFFWFERALQYWIIWPCLVICIHLLALKASVYAESLKVLINSVNLNQK